MAELYEENFKQVSKYVHATSRGHETNPFAVCLLLLPLRQYRNTGRSLSNFSNSILNRPEKKLIFFAPLICPASNCLGVLTSINCALAELIRFLNSSGSNTVIDSYCEVDLEPKSHEKIDICDTFYKLLRLLFILKKILIKESLIGNNCYKKSASYKCMDTLSYQPKNHVLYFVVDGQTKLVLGTLVSFNA